MICLVSWERNFKINFDNKKETVLPWLVQVVHVIVDDRLQSRRANEEQW